MLYGTSVLCYTVLMEVVIMAYDDFDLWGLFKVCSEGTKRCIGCTFNNQRTDGFCCALADRISEKLLKAREETKNGKPED